MQNVQSINKMFYQKKIFSICTLYRVTQKVWLCHGAQASGKGHV